jgi:hypothetical protein
MSREKIEVVADTPLLFGVTLVNRIFVKSAGVTIWR